MVGIGKSCGRNIIAVITNMDEPLGRNVGNALEVIEAVDVLRGNGDKSLRELSVYLAANMLSLSFRRDIDECIIEATNALDSGRAFDKFRELVEAQGGDVDYINDTSLFKKTNAFATYYRRATDTSFGGHRKDRRSRRDTRRRQREKGRQNRYGCGNCTP